MADAIDSKSVVLWACGFDPRLLYHAKSSIFYIIRSISQNHGIDLFYCPETAKTGESQVKVDKKWIKF